MVRTEQCGDMKTQPHNKTGVSAWGVGGGGSAALRGENIPESASATTTVNLQSGVRGRRSRAYSQLVTMRMGEGVVQ